MIRQIPGVSGLVWALHDKQAGEVWETEEIEAVRRQIEGAGFHMEVVESVNVHDDIKIGLPARNQYIENYKTTLRNLAKFGVKVVTYNFMPIFDWTRTERCLRPVMGEGEANIWKPDLESALVKLYMTESTVRLQSSTLMKDKRIKVSVIVPAYE